MHNGESDGWPCKVFADYGAYLGTHRILDEWKQRLENSVDLFDEEDGAYGVDERIRDGIIVVEGPVRAEMFRKEWIPIMECNGDVFWAIDLAPDRDGIPGQIIEVDWEGCSWKVISSSFSDFLKQYADCLEAAEYKVVDGRPTKASDT